MQRLAWVLVFSLIGCNKGDDTDVIDTDPLDTDVEDTADTDIVEVDADGDGYPEGEDCDDGDEAINPGAAEICDPSDVDEDCDGDADEDDDSVTGLSTFHQDGDGDGYGVAATAMACEAGPGLVENETDCDDLDPSINPAADEVCDDLLTDEDCDGAADDGSATGTITVFADDDNDGFGDDATTATQCHTDANYPVDEGGDCDDDASDVFPGAAETCDGADDDCDGAIDDGVLSTFYGDTDNDGFGDLGIALQACARPSGYAADGTDCDDGDPNVFPGAPEVCDVERNDCDQLTWAATDEDGTVAWIDDATRLATDVTSSFTSGTSGSPSTYHAPQTPGVLQVCAGTYYTTIDVEQNSDARVLGPWGAGYTVIDGGGVARAAHFARSTVDVEGITFRNGHADIGGAVYIDGVGSGVNVTMRACVVSGSTATVDGGGITLYHTATLDLVDSIVEGNTAARYGGGIAIGDYSVGNDACSVTCTGSAARAGVLGNTDSNGAVPGHGAGVRVNNAASTFSSDTCDFGEPTTSDDQPTGDIGIDVANFQFGDDATFGCAGTTCATP